MPAKDKTGPLGEGPFTGRKGGNPPPRLGSRFGFRSLGRGFGRGRRPCACPFFFGWPFAKQPTQIDLKSQKEELKKLHQEELADLDQLIKETK